MKLLKRIKQKRCEKCVHKYQTDKIFACWREYKHKGFNVLYPLRLFCLKYERK